MTAAYTVVTVPGGGPGGVDAWYVTDPSLIVGFHGYDYSSIWYTHPPDACQGIHGITIQWIRNIIGGLSGQLSWNRTVSNCTTRIMPNKYFGFGADFQDILPNIYKIDLKSGQSLAESWGAWNQIATCTDPVDGNDAMSLGGQYGPDSMWAGGWVQRYGHAWTLPVRDPATWYTYWEDDDNPVSIRYVSGLQNSWDTNKADTGTVVYCTGVRLWGTGTPPTPPTTPDIVTAMGLAVDFESGTNVWVTAAVNGAVNVYRYDGSTDDIGAAPALTYAPAGMTVGYPRAVWQPSVANFGDICYVFGASSGATILETLDAGSNWTSRTTGQEVTALAAKGDGAGELQNFYAFCAIYSGGVWSTGKVFKETAWAWDAGTDISRSFGKNCISVGYDADATMLEVANVRAGGITKVGTAPEPYTVYTDRTDGFPTTGTTHAVQWVTP